jgi:CcmD family protein
MKRFLLAVVLAVSSTGLLAQQPPPKPANEGFVPVEQLEKKEELPAAPLVMSGYAVAWIAIFVYVWSIWQRLGKAEREIADLNRRIAAGGRR